MKAPLDICIGYDPQEAVSFFVLAHSIMRHASRPVRITPLMLASLGTDGFHRPRDPGQSTDFTFTRFLTPHYSHSPVSIFMDCDMLCRSDIWQLVELAESQPYHDLFVVKHDYRPKDEVKFLGQAQHDYPFKNWSSLMVFNRHRCAVQSLTPEYVMSASPMALHQFQWVRDRDKGIGELSPLWNHLVGEYPDNPDARLVHYTLGGPWFPEYWGCEYGEEWRREKLLMLQAVTFGAEPSSR